MKRTTRKLVRETAGGEPYEYYPVGRHIVIAPGVCGGRPTFKYTRIVRIESLWGIPEGLYWYSHDTFEVDTQTSELIVGRLLEPPRYKSWKRLRYKGTFVAPDQNGKWVPCQTAPAYQWRQSITKQSWLFEMAHTTRQVAERENQAVVVMWFIDNHPQASAHKVLPWFHSKAELATPKAAPRTKLSSATDFYIKTVSEWEKFRRDVESGKRIQRVIVEPEDAELIRNQQFARELGALAASNNIVVELSGGILSHAYYVLQRSGASVECIDLYGEDEDVAEYNKLVRDKIPALIEARGERVETVELKGDALVAALQRKLVEEAFEARDAKSGPELIGEMADILEVARSLCGALNVSTSEVEAEREDKRRSRGGFDKGLMLKKTATPHSIPKEPAIYLEPPALNLKADRAPEPIISEIADLPSKPLYRRPDLRQIERQLEKLFTFETDTTLMGDRAGNVDQTLNFSMPMGQGIRGNFALTVELRRTGSSIRGVVRLRPGPLQLEFQFGDAPLERES